MSRRSVTEVLASPSSGAVVVHSTKGLNNSRSFAIDFAVLQVDRSSVRAHCDRRRFAACLAASCWSAMLPVTLTRSPGKASRSDLPKQKRSCVASLPTDQMTMSVHGGELPDGHERSLSCSWLHRSDRRCAADYFLRPPDFRSSSLPEFALLLEWWPCLRKYA